MTSAKRASVAEPTLRLELYPCCQATPQILTQHAEQYQISTSDIHEIILGSDQWKVCTTDLHQNVGQYQRQVPDLN